MYIVVLEHPFAELRMLFNKPSNAIIGQMITVQVEYKLKVNENEFCDSLAWKA